MNTESGPPPSRLALVAAFAAVYVIWGSTYLAIRLGVATLPPFLMAGVRFLVAGGLMLLWLLARGERLPTARQWRNSAIVGTLLLLGGNGLVCWAELTVSSSLAALIVASSPMWFALFDWMRPGGRRPTAWTTLGLFVGFGGVALLAGGPAGSGEGDSGTSLAGVLALVVACASWAGGSIFAKHADKPASPWISTAAQMLCGGAALMVVSAALGEPAAFSWEAVSLPSFLAFLYLIVFGSWVGFGAYVWLLGNCSATKVATYAYVNPVIATFLGWLVLAEPLTARIGVAALVILAGVVIVQWPRAAAPSVPTALAPKPADTRG